MEEGVLSLKWNNHNSTFMHMLSTKKKIETYSDVTLACEGSYFPVHKLVLCICSEYFEEVLSLIKCQQPVIILNGISQGHLQALLNYMYLGEANVAQNELSSFIKAAECLKIKGLAVPDENPLGKEQIKSDSHDSGSKKRKNENVQHKDTLSKVKRKDFSQHHSSNHENYESSVALPVEHPQEVVLDPVIEVKEEILEPKNEDIVTISDANFSYDMNVNNEERQKENSMRESVYEVLASETAGPSIPNNDVMDAWDSSASVGDYPVEYNENLHHPTNTLESMNSDYDYSIGGADNLGRYVCSYCSKPFQFKSSYERHVLVHTGEKPFACSLCDFRSNRKWGLTTHYRNIHNDRYCEQQLTQGSNISDQ